MFTGIVHNHHPICALERKEGFLSLEIELGKDMTVGLERGASVSVSGVCLTAVDIEDGRVRFDVIGETLNRTTLGALNIGDRVNIERAARFGDEIGGHDVSGHVTGVGRLVQIERPANNWVGTFEVDAELMPYIFHKGFIALDGASLTIASVERAARRFTVHLIPETLTRTTFGTRAVGDGINVEVDPRTVAVVDTVEAVIEDRLQALLQAHLDKA